MAVLTINGLAASPSDMQVGVKAIDNAERNANGDMIIDHITTKRTIELSWKYLTAAELSTILNAVTASRTFSVTYRDPVTNTDRTSTFYAGDRTVGMMQWNNGSPRYIGVKFNLVEV